MSQYREKRKYPRATALNLYVHWGRTEDCIYQGDQITSLSLGGCFLLTERHAQSGEIIFMQLWESNKPGGLYKGVVRYQLDVSGSFPSIGLGVEFIDTLEHDRLNLQEVMRFYSHQPEAQSETSEI